MADTVIGQATGQVGQSIQSGGATAADAMQAYHITATAEHARQALEMQKQEQDRNKAVWFTNMVGAIHNASGPARALIADNVKKQLPSVYPNSDPSTIDMISKDPEFGRGTYSAFNNIAQGRGTSEDFQMASDYVAAAPADKKTFIEQHLQQEAAVRGAQLKASGMNGRVDVMKDNQTLAAGKAYEVDPIIKMSKTNLNSLVRSESILQNPDRPVTAKDLNLAYTDYINAVAAGGAATEGKISRELPETWDQKWNELKLKAGNISDLRKDPVGKALIEQLQSGISSVKGDLGDAMMDQAQNIHTGLSQSSNPNVVAASSAKIGDYNSKYSRQALSKKSGHSAASSGPKAGDVMSGYKFKGGDPADQNNWEKQ